MNTNCLVTKIKGEVNDSNLPKLGVFIMFVKSSTNLEEHGYQQEIRIVVNKPCTINAVGNGHISTTFAGLTSDPKTSIPLTSDHRIFVSNTDFNLEVSDKYAITKILSNPSGATQDSIITFSAREFNALTSLDLVRLGKSIFSSGGKIVFNNQMTEINFDNAHANGVKIEIPSTSSVLSILGLWNATVELDINTLTGLSSLTKVNFMNCPKVTGDITSLSGNTNITEMYVGNSSITGSIDSFISSQALIRTICDDLKMTDSFMYNITFNGIHLNEGFAHVTWNTASKIAILAGNINIASCTKVYTKGYTQEEAEAAFSGKTIIRVDA